jgi:mRNA deadenylase 3'-5' endonuclease subunit Ccr4/uncharacterized protein with PIN domain
MLIDFFAFFFLSTNYYLVQHHLQQKHSMTKQKAQKRRLKQKAKKKVGKERSTKHEENWVASRLQWIPFDEFHGAQANGGGDDDDEFVSENEEEKDDCSENSNFDRHQAAEESPEDPNSIKIVSWNVLADSYCNRSSHRDLPMKYQAVVFDRKKRPYLVRKTLKYLTNTLRPDLVCLQEVDPPLGIAKVMSEMDYGVCETIASKDGRNGRVDSCGLYYCNQLWTCLEHETIRLDDLAMLRSGTVEESEAVTRKLYSRSSSSFGENNNGKNNGRSSSLQGLQCSFIRKNVTLLARLEHKVTKQQIVVAVAHLFWNPHYEYVKLCQMHYVAQRAKAFCKNNEPVIVCGDFNSKPNGSVHQYLTKGHVSAKRVAPWYAINRPLQQQESAFIVNDNLPTIDDVTDDLETLHVSQAESRNGTEDPTTIKYMLDFTLNRFCRWMRILGLSVALETEEEERERTKKGNPVILKKCREEGRVLVTTSSKLVQRKDCPAGTYLLDPKGSLEQILVHLLLSHGVKIEPSKMLSRCVVCNGSIEEVHDKHKMTQIFQTHNAPDGIGNEVVGVYQCDGCAQGYWWCDKPTSSASRVKNQATKLLELCIRGGVPIAEDLGMFDYIDVEQIKNEMTEDDDNGNHFKERLDIIKWLQDEELTNPLGSMASAYASPDSGEEALPFTNVTSGFVGHLDYIMYQTQNMKVNELLYVPRTYEDLNHLNIPNGHVLPSCDWPSDHLAIGCRLNLNAEEAKSKDAFTPEDKTQEPDDIWCGVIPNESLQSQKSHGERCACGCVPAIPGLFEMAELRRQAKLKQSVKS